MSFQDMCLKILSLRLQGGQNWNTEKHRVVDYCSVQHLRRFFLRLYVRDDHTSRFVVLDLMNATF